MTRLVKGALDERPGNVTDTVALGALPNRAVRATSTSLTLVRSLARDPFALTAALFLVVLIGAAALAPLIAPHDPTAQDLLGRLKPPAWVGGGARTHLLGTDALGRDLFSRVLYGARVSLTIGFTVVLTAGVVGVVLGLLSGYYGGRFDSLIMRLVDLQTAFPYFLLAVTIIAAVGTGEKNLIIVLALGSWVVYARFARATMLSVRRTAYIEAARAVGCSGTRIVFRHALPNLASPLVTLATLELSRVILAEAGFSFLGLGVQPPTPAWGLMVAEGHSYISSAWWLSTWPGLAIALAALSINIFATWLRAVTDPVQRSRQMNERTGF
ncbi:MAG: ABC transporter permease [Thermomicrobiales bacterium]